MRCIVMPSSKYREYRAFLSENNLRYSKGLWEEMKRAYTQQTGIDADSATLDDLLSYSGAASRQWYRRQPGLSDGDDGERAEERKLPSRAEELDLPFRAAFLLGQKLAGSPIVARAVTPKAQTSSAGTQTTSPQTSSAGTQTPFATRNGSFEDELREHLSDRSRVGDLLNALLRKNGNISPEDLADDAGIPFSKNKMLQLAAISPIWGTLIANKKNRGCWRAVVVMCRKRFLIARRRVDGRPS